MTACAPGFAEPLVVLDFETTGLSPHSGDRITEVAALRIAGGEIVDYYVTLVNCGVRIPSFITALTGISQAMVERAPPCAEVVPALLEFIGRDALVAHNAAFDEKFLLAESARLDLQPAHRHLVCSMKLARRLFPGQASYKLGTLAATFGLRFRGNAHRALADAEVTAHLLHHLGRHVCATYGLGAIDGALLARINKVSAAQTAAFLQKHANEQVNAVKIADL